VPPPSSRGFANRIEIFFQETTETLERPACKFTPFESQKGIAAAIFGKPQPFELRGAERL
jgi:hypothetical protein